MKKKHLILCITILFTLVNFCGCQKVSPEKMLEMLENEQEISLIISNSQTQYQSNDKIKHEWKELGNRENFQNFRERFDMYYGIESYEEYKKVGMIYTDIEGKHTLNSTLRNAFLNQYFIDCFYSEESDYLTSTLASILYGYGYQDSRLAVLNGYFNIFPDFSGDFFVGNYQLSRGEFLAGIYLAEYPVSSLEENIEFKNLVSEKSEDTTTLFSSKMLDYSYLNIDDHSLNKTTYNEPITRAEAIYTLVRMYYNDEYQVLNGTESMSYTDERERISNYMKNNGNNIKLMPDRSNEKQYYKELEKFDNDKKIAIRYPGYKTTSPA